MKALLLLALPALAARPVPVKIRAPLAPTVSVAAPRLSPGVPTLPPVAAPAPQIAAPPLPGRMGTVFTAIKTAISGSPIEDKLDELEPGALLSNGAVLVNTGQDEVRVLQGGRTATISRKKALKLKPAGQERPAGVDWAAAERKQQERRVYKAFVERNHWQDVAATFGPELRKLRALPKTERPAYVRAEGDKLTARLKERFGAANIGFHYNLHGGQRHQYVEGGGIRATMGDIALQYSMHGDRNYKVYFFQTKHHALYDVLSERHPQYMARMGHVLMLFDVDKVPNGVRPSQISLDFDQGFGVPYSAFLMPPLDVFNGTSKKAGQDKLSRDEETLAVMRYIEAAAFNEGPAPEKPQVLGRGEFGVVRSQPGDPSVITKTVDISPGAFLFSLPDPAKVAENEEKTARALGEAGVGPRYLGREGLTSTRERIYGDTLDALIRERRFTAEDEQLVLQMLGRMAAAGLKVDDMKPANIMLGTRHGEAERRAWLVDGGNLLPAPKDAEELLHQQITLLVKWDPAIGEVQFTKPFSQILAEGLERAGQKTWWARFKQGFKDFWSVPVTPGLR